MSGAVGAGGEAVLWSGVRVFAGGCSTSRLGGGEISGGDWTGGVGLTR